MCVPVRDTPGFHDSDGVTTAMILSDIITHAFQGGRDLVLD